MCLTRHYWRAPFRRSRSGGFQVVLSPKRVCGAPGRGPCRLLWSLRVRPTLLNHPASLPAGLKCRVNPFCSMLRVLNNKQHPSPSCPPYIHRLSTKIGFLGLLQAAAAHLCLSSPGGLPSSHRTASTGPHRVPPARQVGPPSTASARGAWRRRKRSYNTRHKSSSYRGQSVDLRLQRLQVRPVLTRHRLLRRICCGKQVRCT